MRPLPAWVKALVAITVVRVVLGAITPVVPEEAYHWNYACHLDWSYYDHPPMVAWVIALGRAIFGDTPFGVRFVPILLAIGTAVVLARFAERLGGAKAALWTVLLLTLQPILFAVGGTGFPDAPLLFFWSLAMTLAWRAIDPASRPDEALRRASAKWYWLAAGAALGAAMLSKYTAAFLVFFIFIHLITSKRDRRWLATPWPYLAGVVALAVFSPVIYWNWTHQWASFKFQSVDRLKEAGEGIKPVTGLIYVGGQLAAMLILTLPLAVLALRRDARSDQPVHRYLFWSFVPMSVFFFALSWTRTVHLMWPMPAYVGLTVAMALHIARGEGSIVRFYESKARWLVGLAAVGLIGAAAHAAFFLPLVFPMRGLYGYAEAAAKAKEIRATLPANAFYLGIGRKYTCTSQLAFHLRAPTDVHGRNLVGRKGLQYDFWADPVALQGRDAVIVVEDSERMSVMEDALRNSFDSVERAGEISVAIGRHSYFPVKPVQFTFLIARGYRGVPAK